MYNKLDYIASSPRPDPQTSPRLLALHDEGEERLFHVLYLHINSPREAREGGPLERPHAHDVYHLLVYSGGHNRLALGGEERGYAPDALVAVSPGEPHVLTPRLPGRVAYHEITFALVGAGGCSRRPWHELLSAYFGVAVPPRRYPAQLTRRIANGFRSLLEGVAKGLASQGQDRVANGSRIAMELFAFLLKNVYFDTHGQEGASPGLPAAKELLERRFREPLRLDELAAAAALSRDHFCRAFGKRYGVSPISYQIELRLQAAKILLTDTTMGCKEIAERVGIRDEFYFSRVFTRRVGMSPGRFRDSQRPSLRG